MKRYYTQFVEWATGLTTDSFFVARIKLSVYYTGIFTLCLCIFSILPILSLRVYIASPSVKNEIQKEEARAGYFLQSENLYDGMIYVPIELEPRVGRVAIAEQIEKDLRDKILLIDLFLIVFSFFASFFLAKKTLAPLEYAMRKEERFARDASHELRTPLAIIKNECELSLRDKHLRIEEAKESLESILEEVDTMTLLTDSLLELSRAKFLSQKNNSTDISLVIQDATLPMDELLKHKHISKQIDIPESVHIRGDRDSLFRIITNIYSNAVQYNREGGSIVVRVQEAKKYVYCHIIDTGIGIDPADLVHIGTPFFKTERSRHGGGIGLGLSLVKSLVKECGATLTLESSPHKGTHVILCFRKA